MFTPFLTINVPPWDDGPPWDVHGAFLAHCGLFGLKIQPPWLFRLLCVLFYVTAQRTLTPAQARAELNNLSSSTLDRWVKDFARHLSPGARPGKGQTRRYTLDDLAVFRRVAYYLRIVGNSPEEVDALLAVPPTADEPSVNTVLALPDVILELQRVEETMRRVMEIVRNQENQIADLADAVEQIPQLYEIVRAQEDRIGDLTEEVRAGRVEDEEMRLRISELEGRGFWDILLGRFRKE